MATSFTDCVRKTKKIGVRSYEQGIERVSKLIRKRLGKCEDETVNLMIDEVIAPRLAIIFGGLEDRTDDMKTVEYAALAIGEDIRHCVLGDDRRLI